MKTTCEKMDNCQLALNVEMEGGEVDKYMAEALEHLAKRVTLPGFRKGKAPSTLVEQQVGKQAILQEALEHLIPEAYEEALKKESITAIAEPKIELLHVEPITFKAIVPLKPNITPGNYREIKLEMGKKEIGDSDIDQVIEQLQMQFGTLVPVERGIQYGDIITCDITAKRGVDQILDRKDAAYEVNQDSKYPAPGFAEKLVGLEKDADTEFTLSFPDDYEVKEIAGKEYTFSVKVKEIKEKSLPEVNDEFAKNAGSENLEDLKEKIRIGLQSRADENLKKEFENKLVTLLIEQSTIEFPPVLVEKEIDHIVNEEARNFADGVKGLENYLSNAKKTMEQHRDDLRPAATDRVKAFLVTSKIGEVEDVKVSEDELTEAIENMIKGDETKAENIRALFSLPQPRESLKEMMIINKTMDLLTKIVTEKADNSEEGEKNG
ncbi:MAG: trigger factor [Dehalococcoidia bacterium]|jgi:trigger factor